MSKPASSFTPRNPRAAGLWRIEASSAGVRLSSLGAWLSGSAVARRFWLPNPRECQSQCDTPFRIPSKDQRLRTARTQTCAPLTVTHLAHHTAVLLPASEGIPSRQQRSDQAAHQCCQLSCYQAVLTPNGNVLSPGSLALKGRFFSLGLDPGACSVIPHPSPAVSVNKEPEW
ncbi:UNVERIFIED_CONTAM: hypothetical protein FKN15_075782 [Acipenser sinensis]